MRYDGLFFGMMWLVGCVVFLQVSSEMTRARAARALGGVESVPLVYIILYNTLLWVGVRELIFTTGLMLDIYF